MMFSRRAAPVFDGHAGGGIALHRRVAAASGIDVNPDGGSDLDGEHRAATNDALSRPCGLGPLRRRRSSWAFSSIKLWGIVLSRKVSLFQLG